MIRYLLGEYKSLVAELKHSEIPAKVDDNVHILLNMENGAVGTIASDRYSPAIGDGTDLYGSEGDNFQLKFHPFLFPNRIPALHTPQIMHQSNHIYLIL